MIPRIREVWIQNYKSFEKARVTLEPFTILVGANGSGKSNFVDALAFVKDCVTGTISDALRKRGGLSSITCQVSEQHLPIGFRFVIDLDDNVSADYALVLGKTPLGMYGTLNERCSVRENGEVQEFEVRDGQFVRELAHLKVFVMADRLALSSLSGAKEFRRLYEFLCSMRFYQIRPELLREWQVPDAGEYLRADGSNVAAVLRRIAEDDGPQGFRLARIGRLLSGIAEGTHGVERIGLPSREEYDEPGRETLLFQKDIGMKRDLALDSSFQSDGTLRATALLIAAYQTGFHPLVAIEEPEATIHPAAAEVILSALRDASHDRQVLITTHSADILDNKEVTTDQIRVVSMEAGRTLVSEVNEAGRAAVRERLYTAGELLRVNELSPDLEAAKRAAEDFDLFGEPFPDGRGES